MSFNKMKKRFIMKKLVLLFFIAVLWFSDMRELISQSSGEGTLYYFTLHPGIVYQNDSLVTMLISSQNESQIYIEKYNESLRENIISKQNDFVKVKLTALEAQATFRHDNRMEKLYEKAAIKILVEDNFSGNLQIQTTYGNKTGGMSVLDVTKLGMKYQIAHSNATKYEPYYPSTYVSIVGIYDYTRVTFKIGGSGGSYIRKEVDTRIESGETINRILNEGDVWLIPANGNFQSLAGSGVSSDKPVAVFSGTNCSMGFGNESCNYTIHQELPEESWGYQYMIPHLAERKDYSVVNAFTKKSGNYLSINGKSQWYITKPGGIFDIGYHEAVIGVLNPGQTIPDPTLITGEKPINIVIVNSGLNIDGNKNFDMEMQILPTEQFSNSALFRIDNNNEDYINIVFKALKKGNMPDDLLITEIIDGKYEWKKLNVFSPDSGQKFYGIFPDSTHFRTKNIKFNNAGTYAIKASEPFAVYRYGVGNSSYGFPVNGSLYELETPDKLAPIIEFKNCCCGSIVGIVLDEPRLDPAKRSNLGQIFMETSDSYNYKFDLDPFIYGVNARTDWSLDIKNRNLDARAHLVFIDKAGNRFDTVFQYFAINLSLTPNNIDYGSFRVEQINVEKKMQFKIKIEGSEEINEVYSVYVFLDSDIKDYKTGDINTFQGFEILEVKGKNLLPVTLGQEINFEIKFTASKGGSFSDYVGIVVIENSSKDTCVLQYFSLIQAFVSSPYISAKDKNFSEQVFNFRTPEYDLTVTNLNSGEYKATTSLKITGVEFTGDEIGHKGSDAVFEVEGLGEVSETKPIILTPGESRTFSVSFKPKEIKEYNSVITFIADAEMPDNKTILTGMGIPTSVSDEEKLSSKIEILYDNGFLRFYSKEDYQIDEIEIYDLSGKLILNEKINKTLDGYSLRTTNFTSGVNIVKMYVNGKWFSKKVII